MSAWTWDELKNAALLADWYRVREDPYGLETVETIPPDRAVTRMSNGKLRARKRDGAGWFPTRRFQEGYISASEAADWLGLRRDCRVCGGDGWTDGSAELRRDGRRGDTTCIACKGTGKERA